MLSAKRRLEIVLPQMLTAPSLSSKAFVMNLSRNMLKRVSESSHTCRTPTVVREPVYYAAVDEDGTSGLVMEISDDSDRVCAVVIILYGCPQSCMPNPVKGLLEVNEDTVEVLLLLEIFLTEDS